MPKKKLPREEVIEKQDAVVAGEEVKDGDLEQVSGGVTRFIPVYGVPRITPRPRPRIPREWLRGKKR